MNVTAKRRERFRKLIDEHCHGNKAAMARRLNKEPSYISRMLYEEGKPGAKGISDKLRVEIESEFNLPYGWMDGVETSADHSGFLSEVSATYAGLSVQKGQPGQVGTFEIPYWNARGSCGGGSLNQEEPPKGMLIKEQSWFDRFDCKPGDCVVVYADGDSMADYICDGDMVFFNKSKTTPRSGKVYLIQHPDGLRIKQLRREIDGTWVLESRNPDKRRYPDERIPPGHSELLVIVGEQFYRQG